jgi:hypothetical protein
LFSYLLGFYCPLKILLGFLCHLHLFCVLLS